jgi:hypothetical protein
MKHYSPHNSMPDSVADRHGSALLVVVTMMSALMFMGLFFFFYVNTARNSAEAFASVSYTQSQSTDYFDWGLDQLLLGPTSDLRLSALYGGQHSMIPTLIGSLDDKRSPTDMHPNSSRGVDILYDSSSPTNFYFDTNGDGLADSNQSNYIMNYSAAANSGAIQSRSYQPDAGYTYPDINSMFLAHLSYVDLNTAPGMDSASTKLVLIPSFFRPQYMNRDTSATTNYFTSASTRNQVLRPHQLHMAEDGITPRFVSTGTPPIMSETGVSVPINPFPFLVGVKNEMGIWTKDPTTVTPSDYELDVDNDLDGTKDGILLDLDYPISIDPSTQTSYVPLFSFLVLDADGLANLNSAGNLNQLKLANTAAGAGHSYLANDILTIEDNTTQAGKTYNLVSSSNLGLSMSEINIARMLVAGNITTQSTTPDPYTSMFAFSGSSIAGIDSANMELTRLLLGGPKTTLTDAYAGRYGLDNTNRTSSITNDRLIDALYGNMDADGNVIKFPTPGNVVADDDGDFNNPSSNSDDYTQSTLGFGWGTSYLDKNLMGLRVPWQAHPLDYVGIGSMYSNNATGGMTFNKSNPATSNPVQYLNYQGAWQYTGGISDAATSGFTSGDPRPYGINSYYNALNSTGLLQPAWMWNVDEDDELMSDPLLVDYNSDQPFEVSLMEELQLSDTDIGAISPSPSERLRQLAPYNFKDSTYASSIRKQFTTLSMDRIEFSQNANYYSSSSPLTSLNRSWEFYNPNNVNEDKTTRNISRDNLYFPPAFNTTRTNVAYAYGIKDPVRPEVRTLLSIKTNHKSDDGEYLPQRKLNLNKLLTINPQTQAPLYRNLTPHPSFNTIQANVTIQDMVHDNTTTALPYQFSTITTDVIAQEWWARYDRQRMARDIYVMLWILGGGRDVGPSAGTVVDYATTNNYSPAAAKQMAQFAVNVVDAMDPDNVITKFEYDEELAGSGWDDATEVVYGQEAQDLTLSEAIWIHLKKNAANQDHTATLWKDDNIDHQFLFVELRNSSPFDVKLQTDSYRIKTYYDPVDDQDSVNDGLPTVNIGTVEFQGTTGGVAPLAVSAGANFIIGTHDGHIKLNNDESVTGTEQQAAVFRIQLDASVTGHSHIIPFNRNLNAPANLAAAPATTAEDPPVCHLDLCHLDHRSKFKAKDSSNSAIVTMDASAVTNNYGFLLPNQTIHTAIDPSAKMRIVLERRMNPQAPGWMNDNTNPWIEIDRFNITLRQLDVPNSSTKIYDKTTTDGWEPSFLNLKSFERKEPFDIAPPVDNSGDNKILLHSFGATNLTTTTLTDPLNPYYAYDATRLNQRNSNGVDKNTIFQPHFDRPFYSIMELLSIPLYGPWMEKDTNNNYANPMIAATNSTLISPKGLVNTNNSSKMDGHATAQFKILNPNLTGVTGAPSDEDMLKNHWHRLLNYVYVDTTTQAEQFNSFNWNRTPGKINLNTIRTTGQNLDLNSLAALIDDEYHLGTDFNLIDDRETSSSRDWGQQFLMARDGFDPFIAQTFTQYVSLPGVPSSKPFRSLDYIDPISPIDSISSTILRPHKYHNVVQQIDENTLTYTGTQLNPAGTLNRRNLFEARNDTDLSANTVDYYSKNRILSKIDNLTTNKSHVFYVWITVQFHEAVVDEYGNTRIGAKRSDMASQRGFFVIDRSLLEYAYDTSTKTFDFNKFVTYRRTLK